MKNYAERAEKLLHQALIHEGAYAQTCAVAGTGYAVLALVETMQVANAARYGIMGETVDLTDPDEIDDGLRF